MKKDKLLKNFKKEAIEKANLGFVIGGLSYPTDANTDPCYTEKWTCTQDSNGSDDFRTADCDNWHHNSGGTHTR